MRNTWAKPVRILGEGWRRTISDVGTYFSNISIYPEGGLSINLIPFM